MRGDDVRSGSLFTYLLGVCGDLVLLVEVPEPGRSRDPDGPADLARATLGVIAQHEVLFAVPHLHLVDGFRIPQDRLGGSEDLRHQSKLPGLTGHLGGRQVGVGPQHADAVERRLGGDPRVRDGEERTFGLFGGESPWCLHAARSQCHLSGHPGRCRKPRRGRLWARSGRLPEPDFGASARSSHLLPPTCGRSGTVHCARFPYSAR